MFIFLDESYNLKDRAKPQFISINGFSTTAVRKIWKKWRFYRNRFIGKARIHASDRRFEYLREKSLELISLSPEATFLTVNQDINELPVNPQIYYKKDKLDFEKVYEDILKSLLKELSLQEYKRVVINIDNRKQKGGILGKRKFQEAVLIYLKECYPNTIFQFISLPSSSNILLEIADFISNSFYRYRVEESKRDFMGELRGKIIRIKNPLGKPRG